MADRALTLHVEDEILVRLEALARDIGRSSEQLVEEALKQYVEYESWWLAATTHCPLRSPAMSIYGRTPTTASGYGNAIRGDDSPCWTTLT